MSAGIVPAMGKELALTAAGQVDLDKVYRGPAAIRLLLPVLLQAVAGRLVRRRHELDDGDDAPTGAQVDDLDESLRERLRFGGKNNRLRNRDPASRRNGQISAAVFHDANVGTDPPAGIEQGVFDDQAFSNASDEAVAQLSLNLVGCFNDQARMHIQPMRFKVRIHSGKRAFHVMNYTKIQPRL